MNKGISFQVGIYAETAKSLMHRDFFIGLTTTISSILFFGIYEEIGEESNLRTKTLKKPIGELDMKIHFVYTHDGLQISILSHYDRENFTMTWDDIFNERYDSLQK